MLISSKIFKDFFTQERMQSVRMLKLALSVYTGNANRTVQICRSIMNKFPELPDGIRMYIAMIIPNMEGINTLKLQMNEKFIRRHYISLDSIKRSRGLNHTQLITYAHTCCALGHVHMATRNVGSAIGYYIKSFYILRDDPLINLSLAIAHLTRAMQSRSENRHEHVMRCLGFLCRYERICKDSLQSEVHYNFARTFQQLGIITFLL